MMSMSAVSVAMADDLCGRGSSAPRIATKMRGTMARRPYGPRTRLSPDHTPHVRSNILRSDRYEFVAGPHVGCARFTALRMQALIPTTPRKRGEVKGEGGAT